VDLVKAVADVAIFVLDDLFGCYLCYTQHCLNIMLIVGFMMTSVIKNVKNVKYSNSLACVIVK
jgi:hypothetical protein